jgi:hypothetical protein
VLQDQYWLEKSRRLYTTVGSLQRLLFFIPYIFFSILSVEKSVFSNFKATVARDCDAIKTECVWWGRSESGEEFRQLPETNVLLLHVFEVIEALF